MQPVIETLKAWHTHPFIDHFTVALILIGIVTDLIATLFSARLWLRYMALTLMILGAAFAWGSWVTGGWAANQVWDSVTGPGKDVLRRHAWWGNVLPWVFTGLAIWRIGAQFIRVIAEFRPIYLLVAIAAGAGIFYQGYLGGELVYGYGVGTALLTPAATAVPPSAVPSPQATFSGPVPSGLIPSFSPTPTPLASMLPTPTPMVSAVPAPMNTPAAPATPPPAAPSPATPSPAANPATPLNPPPGAASTTTPSGPKNL